MVRVRIKQQIVDGRSNCRYVVSERAESRLLSGEKSLSQLYLFVDTDSKGLA